MKLNYSYILFVGLVSLIFAQAKTDTAPAQEQDPKPSERQGYLVQVPLPINGASAKAVRQTIERLVEKAPNAFQPDQQPVIVLEFDTSNGKSGKASKLESCLELARFLSKPDLNRVRTVAYIPAPKSFAEQDGAQVMTPTSQLNGHAVLVAIAANEIAMHRGAAIGKADAGEQDVDDLIRDVYRRTALAKRTLPPEIVMAMVDPDEELYRVPSESGIKYVNAEGLRELARTGDADDQTTVASRGKTISLTSEQLAKDFFIKKRVNSRVELARAFELPPNSLEGDPTLGKEWNAARMELPNYIDASVTSWVSRALGTTEANLLIFEINASGGDPDACFRLARRLAEYDSNEIRTVAYVTGVARGPAALVALSCDHLIMNPAAEVGGVPDPVVDAQWVKEKQDRVESLANAKDRDWSLFVSVLNPDLAVNRYTNIETGELRLLTEAQRDRLADPGQWNLQGPLGVRDGINAQTAEQFFIARAMVEDDAGLQAFYQLDAEPRELTPTMSDRWIDKVAKYLASPFVAPWLLFAAVFFLSTEMSAPGVGVPGFLGTLCLVAFFWSQTLDGNANWLEILLFLLGVAFILMEIFLLPGFGIFGIGGLLMVIVSVILATQSFIIPRTTAELNRLPISLSMVLAGAMGFFVAVAVLRKVLPNTPYLKRMMLEPPTAHNETGLEGDSDPSAIVDWSYLQDRKGEAVTRLVPSGKAMIDGEVFDVISDGRMIDKGARIVVAEAIGNRIVVKPADV